MPSDREERDRVFGVPIGPRPGTPPGEEARRVLGFAVGDEALQVLTHPVREFRRWWRSRAESPR